MTDQMKIKWENIDQIFHSALMDNREILYEHEIYGLLQEIGIQVPRHQFLPYGKTINREQLNHFPGNRVILKVVSPSIVHKTDVGGVQWVEKRADRVNAAGRHMTDTIEKNQKGGIIGLLICEVIEFEKGEFGSEILIGMRNSREFGAIISVGIGGLDVEYLSNHLIEKQSHAMISPLLNNSNPKITKILESLAIFNKLTKRFRGREPWIKTEQLLNTCQRFLKLSRHYNGTNSTQPYVIEEAEINPFVIHQNHMIPLDGMCRFSRANNIHKTQSKPQISKLLKPETMAIIGVSQQQNLGRIILQNILKAGFQTNQITVIKPGTSEIEGCRCIRNISHLAQPVDLFILALDAESSYETLQKICEQGKAYSIIMIAGGIGEIDGSKDLENKIKQLLNQGRKSGKITPVINGGNCLGIISKPGKYDSTFIPKHKLYEHTPVTGKTAPLAFLSQSGAFLVSQLSKNPDLAPLYAISVGNQIDLTITDYMQHLKNDPNLTTFALYIEGFQEKEGLAFAQLAEEITQKEGKTVIVYKAGRTAQGRAATAGHTASVAGDYQVCQGILEAAGVILCDNILEFEYTLRHAMFLREKKVRGWRVGLVSNAGFECVIMSDHLKNDKQLQLADLSLTCKKQISEILTPLGITQFQQVKNPLDLTPLANDDAFASCIQAIVNDMNVDCLVISPSPMTGALNTLPPQNNHGENLFSSKSLANRLIKMVQQSDKPILINIEGGQIYNPMREFLFQAEIPVFKRCDDAMMFLNKYIHTRLLSS